MTAKSPVCIQPALADALAAAVAQLCPSGGRLAVRSSAVDEDAVPVAPVAVAQSQPAAAVVHADFAGFDLGGLVLVQTRVEALAAAAATPQPEAEPALRRADLPKAAADDAPDMPLVQVETRR